MFSEVHTDFILNPLMDVLAEGVHACISLPVGIENCALGEYYMQSLFLRVTGAQEQKLKCICWVMATNDYYYRYNLLRTKNYGECSEYKHKKGIYVDLCKLIQGYDSKFTALDVLADLHINDSKEQFVKDIIQRLMAVVEHSPLTAWNYREYQFFQDHWQDVVNDKQLVLSDNELFGPGLQEFYKQLVVKHRNRIAHNTASYQKDVPTLNTLADQSYVYKNYFFRFGILLVIDEVFTLMFKKYRRLGLMQL